MYKGKSLFVFPLVLLFFASGALYAKITKGPYVQNVGLQGITVMWETDTQDQAMVQYGKGKRLQHEALAEAEPFQVTEWEGAKRGPKTFYKYEVHLADLEPATQYRYQITSGEQTGGAFFQTAVPPGTPFRFVVYGDNRTREKEHSQVVKAILKSDPAFVLHSGDYVTRGQYYEQWDGQFFKPLEKLMNHVPIFGVRGNHENKGPFYEHFFSLPEPELWYAFDYGDAHFVGLDCFVSESDRSRMFDWLEKDLAESQARWKFVMYHVPSFNAGGHRTRWEKERITRIFRKYEVNVVFAGHSHLYERTYPMRSSFDAQEHPVTYIVTGGGGAPLYVPGEEVYIAKAGRDLHYCRVDVDKRQCSITVLTSQGSKLDEFTLTKDPSGAYTKKVLDQVFSQEIAELTEAIRDEMLVLGKDLDKVVRKGPISVTCKLENLFFPSDIDLVIKHKRNKGGWKVTPNLQKIHIPHKGTAEVSLKYEPPHDSKGSDAALRKSLKLEITLLTSLGETHFTMTPLWENGNQKTQKRSLKKLHK